MAAVGCRHADIAKRLGITPEKLRQNFRKELDTAAIEANAKVLEALFEMAISGKNTTAAIFWAKTRCGLRDKTGPRGALKQVPPALVVRAEL